MVRYLKTRPTEYVMQFKGGQVKREGPGLSFFYWEPTSTLVLVPLSSADVPFAFQETTADFQTITIQGQLTWRVVDAKKLASLLDYSVTRAGAWKSEDPHKLEERLVHTAQVLTRGVVGKLVLTDALARSEELAAAVLKGLKASDAVQALGVDLLAVTVLSMKPTPEMARALEAETREAFQKKGDQAMYERRTAAVEQERRVKESELQTEVMTEQKRRHIRETKMAADIAMEKEREQLVLQKAENDKKAAEAQAWALAKQLEPLRTMDWKVLSAMQAGGGDPATMIAVAFRELAENAERIGELNVSPDLLRALIPANPVPVKK
ncbi:MAG: SPFH domain-containing protein [Archangium sp.]|nr:SPFH domain-containing protein [Archangium sp.]